MSTIAHRARTLRALVQATLAVAIATITVACGGGGGDTGPVAPTVSTQPADQSVVEGASATFTVAAAGTGPLAYQWSSSTDGTTYTAVAGAVGSSHAIATTTLAQNGTQYRVAVSNASGNVISSAARLTVTAAIVAPTITVQPASQTVTAPATATFNVTASGTAPSYQWQVSVDAGATFTAVPSAPDSPTLTIAATTTALSSNRYRVRVINAAGTATSSVATLTVNPTPVAPSFTTQPAAQTVIAGQTATFTAAAAGTPAPALQWRLNGTSTANGPITTGSLQRCDRVRRHDRNAHADDRPARLQRHGRLRGGQQRRRA